MEWWERPLGELVAGRRVVVAGGPAVTWTSQVAVLRNLGAREVLVVGTEGMGVGSPPANAQLVVAEVDSGADVMARIHAGIDVLAHPPPHIVDAVEAFDPDRTAVVFGSFLTETPSFVGRPLVAHRRPEWVALEDKTRLADLLDRAGVDRTPSVVVPVEAASQRWRELDDGTGTVWAADASAGYHGGGARTRWVTDGDEASAAAAELAPFAETVRIMPFLEGIATSIHGIVLPDGVVTLRPVELVTLRRGHSLVYSGCATFWDPPEWVRDEMRDAARLVGEQLRRSVDFRGAFTLDGIATRDGFRPTEINPRFGAGLTVLTAPLGVPLTLLLDLVVAGRPLGVDAAWLEELLVTTADGHRSGGTWRLDATIPQPLPLRGAVYDGTTWRWTTDGEDADGYAIAGGTYARLELVPERTPLGDSIGPRATAFWRFFDSVIGTSTNPLEAAADVLTTAE